MEKEDRHKSSIPEGMKVLITGASGFIGGHVTRYFVEKGCHVVALVRHSSDVTFISDLPVKIVKGDINDKQFIETNAAGVDLIIHTAGKVNDWGHYREFYKVNVEGTLNVLEAAKLHQVPRVIITGSISCYGEEDCHYLKKENSPYNSHYHYAFDRIFPSGMNHYRDSKAAMTKKSLEFAEKNGLNLVILEPVWVYGENEFSSGFYEYLRSVGSGVHFMPGSRTNTFHVVHARDLARAYWLAATKELQGVQRLIIGNPKADNMERLMELFCQAAGFRSPVLVPKYVSYPLGFLLELLYTLAGAKKSPILTRARVNMYYDSIAYETKKAEKVLGFESQVPLEEGIRDTVRWYRQHQYL